MQGVLFLKAVLEQTASERTAAQRYWQDRREVFRLFFSFLFPTNPFCLIPLPNPFPFDLCSGSGQTDVFCSNTLESADKTETP